MMSYSGLSLRDESSNCRSYDACSTNLFLIILKYVSARKKKKFMVHKFVVANPNKSILSITCSFYLNATREKGEIIVILLIVEVLKQSPLFGHLTEYFIFCLLMVCVKIFDFNLYYIVLKLY